MKHGQLDNLVSDVSACKKSLSCLLNSISDEGYWRNFDESWSPIISAFALDLLLDAGLKPQDEWYVYRDEIKVFKLSQTIDYLNSKISEDGFFGTDFWDSCKLAHTIEEHNLMGYFSNYYKLNKYILCSIQENSIYSRKSEWMGPGFLAAAIDYLDLIKRTQDSEILTRRLLESQDHSDGKWMGIEGKKLEMIVSPVWHTSQAILTLNRRGPIEYKGAIDRGIDWLISNQERDGIWLGIHQYQIYFTSYAVIALSETNFNKTDAILKAVNYLKSKMDPSTGSCSDLGGTIMFALAFCFKISNEGYNVNQILENIISRSAIERSSQLEKDVIDLKNMIKHYEKQIDFYEKKFGNADISFSKRDIFIISIVISILSILVSIVLTLATINGERIIAILGG